MIEERLVESEDLITRLLSEKQGLQEKLEDAH